MLQAHLQLLCHVVDAVNDVTLMLSFVLENEPDSKHLDWMFERVLQVILLTWLHSWKLKHSCITRANNVYDNNYSLVQSCWLPERFTNSIHITTICTNSTVILSKRQTRYEWTQPKVDSKCGGNISFCVAVYFALLILMPYLGNKAWYTLFLVSRDTYSYRT